MRCNIEDLGGTAVSTLSDTFLNFNNCALSSCYSLSVAAFMCEQFTLRLLCRKVKYVVQQSGNMRCPGVHLCKICTIALATVSVFSFNSYWVYLMPLVSNYIKSAGPLFKNRFICLNYTAFIKLYNGDCRISCIYLLGCGIIVTAAVFDEVLSALPRTISPQPPSPCCCKHGCLIALW